VIGQTRIHHGPGVPRRRHGRRGGGARGGDRSARGRSRTLAVRGALAASRVAASSLLTSALVISSLVGAAVVTGAPGARANEVAAAAGAGSLRSLATDRFREGDVAGARAALQELLTHHRDAGADTTDAALAALFDLGACHLRLGELGPARLAFERAVAGFEARRPQDPAALALALEGLTAVLVAQESTGAAAESLARARALREARYGPDHPQTVRLDALQGRLARLDGRHEDALAAMERAKQGYRRIHGNVHPTVAAVVRNFTDIHLEMGKPAEAELMALQADFITGEIYGERAPERVGTLAALGQVRWQQGDFARSEARFGEALAILAAHGNTSLLEVAACEGGLGRARLAAGDAAGALVALERAAAAYERAWWQAGLASSRATFMASPYPLLAAARLLASERADDPATVAAARAAAWQDLERHHGRTLRLARWSRALSPAERAARDSPRQRAVTLTQTLARSVVGGDEAHVAALRRGRADVDAALLALDAQLAARLPEWRADPAAVAVPPGSALVGWLDAEVTPGRTRSWAWVLTSGQPVRWVALPPAAGLADLAAAHRAELVAPGPSGSSGSPPGRRQPASDTARRLFALRLAPCLPLLADVETLVVVPDAALAGIPLTTLCDDRGRQAIDRWNLVVAPSATAASGTGPPAAPSAAAAPAAAATVATAPAAAGPAASPAAGLALLAVADPPFRPEHAAAMRRGEHAVAPGASPSRGVLAAALRGTGDLLRDLARLPATRREVERVAQHFGRADLLLGEEAREEALHARQRTGQLAGYDVIHLATHALVDAVQPERSALVLSQVDLPDGLVDGLLTAQEITAGWELRADLVTLSACETGLGRPAPGEGYLGFTQAFLAAGARSVLVSLWQVDDQATALLMDRLYANLRERGLGKAGALREAQQWLRSYEAGGRRPFAAPRAWGAFVLVGEG